VAASSHSVDPRGVNEGDTGDPVRGRRRGAAWSSVAYGLHVPAGAGETAALQAWQLLLPRHGCFTHLTGASLRGWWLPPLPEGLPVFVALRPNDVRPDREGIRSIRTFGTDRYDLIDGVRVAGATEILLACARDVGLLDLVVLIDAALHSSDLTLDELAKAASRRRRGAPALRRALGYAHPKSESAWETLLRVCHRVCDIDVEPQHEVFNEHGGLVARGDLWIVGTNEFHEYDGDDHLDRRRQVRDLRRIRRLDGESWARRGYTSEDVLTRPIGILRDADRTLGREHRPERIKAWYSLLRESCFTPAGQQCLLERLGIERAA
jgi:hypothetical protein